MSLRIYRPESEPDPDGLPAIVFWAYAGLLIGLVVVSWMLAE